MTNKKTILLTGSTGFLGSELLQRFVMSDYNIKILIRPEKGVSAQERFRQAFENAGADVDTSSPHSGKVKVFEGDITDTNLGLSSNVFNELKNSVDEVFHCAAAVKFSEINRDVLYSTNCKGAQNILDFCISGRKKHLHHVSTAYVAGRKKGFIYENNLDDSNGFHNLYEDTKFLAEKKIHEYSIKHGLTFTIYRPSIIIGNSKTGYTKNFDNIYFYAKTLSFLKRRLEFNVHENKLDLNGLNETKIEKPTLIPLRIPAKSDATINLVPIDYVVNAIISISLDRNRTNSTFHIVNPDPPILSFILESINEAIGVTGPSIVDYNEFKTKKMAPFEKTVLKKLEIYNLYMYNEPCFQSNNTFKILNDLCIKCPKVTKRMFSVLINYAIANKWGNNITAHGHK